MSIRYCLSCACLLLSVTLPLAATITVTLSPNLPGPQFVGTSITWTAAANDTQAGAHEFRFGAQPNGGLARILKDFSPQNFWTWTPADFEGTFNVQVTVRNISTGSIASASVPYQIASRLVGGYASVNPTSHPLVALFSAPPCLKPNRLHVLFGRPGDTVLQSTNWLPCRAVAGSPSPDLTSMNFYVAGMYANSTYLMHWESVDLNGATVTTGTPYAFTTGSIPSSVSVPLRTVIIPPPADSVQPIVLQSFSIRTVVPASNVATDLQGNVLWYCPYRDVTLTRTNLDGSMLLIQKGTGSALPGLREVDLAGNVVAETTVNRVSEQLVAAGYRRIYNFNHDARRIYNPGKPNDGYIVVIGATDMVSTQYQGGTPSHAVDIIGDEIIVLDRNLQLAWAWNPFVHLDVSRAAVLGETCYQTGTACVPFSPGFSQANDWMHTNSVQYTPWDGNLIISMRHQDWVIKINYADGAGNGSVLWRMGLGGDFTVTTQGTQGLADVGYPWFSHQHDAEFELRGTQFGGRRVMTIFDNGNTRHARFNPSANSRCQSYAIDEQARAANLNVNADQGVFSVAVGSAQLLANGEFSCDSGAINGGTNGVYSRTIGSDKTGNIVYVQQWQAQSYRSFRMGSMYSAVTP